MDFVLRRHIVTFINVLKFVLEVAIQVSLTVEFAYIDTLR